MVFKWLFGWFLYIYNKSSLAQGTSLSIEDSTTNDDNNDNGDNNKTTGASTGIVNGTKIYL